jgi:hypothetical protein
MLYGAMLLFEFEFLTKSWRGISAEALAISQALGLLDSAELTIHLELSFKQEATWKKKPKSV